MFEVCILSEFFLFKYIVFSKWDNDIYCLQSDFLFTILINNSPQLYFKWLYGTLLYGHTIINWLITYYYYIFTLSSFLFYFSPFHGKLFLIQFKNCTFNLANLYNCLIKKLMGNRINGKIYMHVSAFNQITELLLLFKMYHFISY